MNDYETYCLFGDRRHSIFTLAQAKAVAALIAAITGEAVTDVGGEIRCGGWGVAYAVDEDGNDLSEIEDEARDEDKDGESLEDEERREYERNVIAPALEAIHRIGNQW